MKGWMIMFGSGRCNTIYNSLPFSWNLSESLICKNNLKTAISTLPQVCLFKDILNFGYMQPDIARLKTIRKVPGRNARSGTWCNQCALVVAACTDFMERDPETDDIFISFNKPNRSDLILSTSSISSHEL
jgi:hypothetical protein